MRLFQAVEAAYTAFRAFSRDDGDPGSRLTSIGFVSVPAFAMFANSAGRLSVLAVVAILVGICCAMYWLLDRRRAQLAVLYWPAEWEPTLSQRLAIVAFMTASTVGIAFASRHSLGAAALVYLTTGLLPLRQSIDAIGKRSTANAVNLAKSLKPDIGIRVRFKTPAEGGRRTPIEHRIGYYGCPIYVGEVAFDCRIPLTETLALGEWHRLEVTFLHPDLALPHVTVGTRIGLWDGRIVAEGVVERICHG